MRATYVVDRQSFWSPVLEGGGDYVDTRPTGTESQQSPVFAKF